jgi:hypothetical protein
MADRLNQIFNVYKDGRWMFRAAAIWTKLGILRLVAFPTNLVS